MPNNEKQTAGQPQVGSDARLAVEEVIDHAKWLIMSYRGMCDRLQASVQKHHLGLGGEKVDVLVCEALDYALSANDKDHATDGARDENQTKKPK